MQKVVSNSSPIIHLSKIGKLNLLKEYFDTITIPEIVYRESVMEGKDRVEVELIKNAEWIKVSQVKDKKFVKLLQTSLDDGESEAITLSLEIGADLILLDDSDARERARLYGLKIIGTIGILLHAKMDGKITFSREELKRLKKTGFWIGDKLEARLLREAGETL